jgi:predicted RNA-binding protein with PIN domain
MATEPTDRSDPLPGPVSDSFVRPALEHVVEFLRRARLTQPRLRYPSQLRRHLRPGRLGAADLRQIRRLVDADADFRAAVAAELDDAADPVVTLWLRRPEGWESELARLEAESTRRRAAAAEGREALAERRRREAAEQRAERAEAEVARVVDDLDSLRGELEAQRSRVDELEAEVLGIRAERDAARVLARNEADRLAATRERLERAEGELAAARAETRGASAVRDAALADRARTLAEVGDLIEAADTARRLADRLADLLPDTEPAAEARTPLPTPGRLAGDPVGLARHLVRSGATVLIDGYNVSKAWCGDLDLEAQRRRLVDACEGLAARHGADISVIFDGSDVAGGHSPGRRVVRVAFSEPGVTADDVLRAEVRRLPPTRPVVVVTDDNAVRRDVRAAGANLVHSPDFIALLQA